MNADPSTTAFMALRLRLRQYASRVLCSEAEADDAVQELFLRTWRKIPAKGEAAYLFASLRNICVDSLRRRTLAARHDADPGSRSMKATRWRTAKSSNASGLLSDNGFRATCARYSRCTSTNSSTTTRLRHAPGALPRPCAPP